MTINRRELSLIAVFAALSVVCDAVVTPGFSAERIVCEIEQEIKGVYAGRLL